MVHTCVSRMPRSPVRHTVSIALVLGALLARSGPSHAQSRSSGEMFDPIEVVNGIEINRRTCEKLEADHTAVWVDIAGGGHCLRYYAAGLKPAGIPNPIAAIWLNGDVLGPTGRNADKRQKGYGPSTMITQELELFRKFGVPSIFLARPGTYGSSGKHYTMRGRPLEATVVNAAIDAIVERYGIGSLSLGGHSGGGTLVAELLARRRDLLCAVISSGAAAYRAYLEARGLAKPEVALSRFDPYESLDRIPHSSERRVFVIGDPRETNVPFSTQALYYDGLASRGHAAWLVPLERAADARHHDLVDFGETAMGMCAAGSDSGTVVDTLNSMPDPPPRRTN